MLLATHVPHPKSRPRFLHEVGRVRSSRPQTPVSLLSSVCLCWVTFSEPQAPHLGNGSPTMSTQAWDGVCVSPLRREPLKGRPYLSLICVPCTQPRAGQRGHQSLGHGAMKKLPKLADGASLAEGLRSPLLYNLWVVSVGVLDRLLEGAEPSLGLCFVMPQSGKFTNKSHAP